MDDQAGCFRNRHEVAGHAFVGDSDRAACCDLFFEQRNDRASGTEHVAEPDGGELRFACLRKVLNDHFSKALRGAHDIRRVDGFVGGDKDEMADAECVGGFSDVFRAEDVVLHRFERVRFHERDVLVGSGVVDHVWCLFRDDVEDPVAVLDICDNGMDFGAFLVESAEFAVDEIN